MSNQAVHSADDMVYTIGLPTRVKADIWTQTHDIEGEDLSMGVMEFEGGLALQYFATTSYTQKTWSPDLVLLDRNMPEMDGISIAEELVAFDPEAKIVIISGYDEDGPLGIDEQGRRLIKGYLTKPINISDLSELLERLL